MKPFAERNPIPIALIGIAMIILGLTAAMNSDDLPIIGAGTSYTAEFREAAGIKSGNEVRVAGIKVGKVKNVELNDKGLVEVTFKVKNAWMGDQTRVGIKLKSLLGTKFLAVDPGGREEMDPDDIIPIDRTSSPYDVLEAFRGLAETVDQVDTVQLAESFNVLSETLADTPDEIKGALDGLSKLSDVIANRDEELGDLLGNAREITETLADRDAQLVKLMKNGNVLLAELSARKQAISSLLQGTQQLAVELNGLVDDNAVQIGPVLKDLDRVTNMLHRNRKAIKDGFTAFAPFVRQFGNVVGSGRWFDNIQCGLILPQGDGRNPDGCDPEQPDEEAGGN